MSSAAVDAEVVDEARGPVDLRLAGRGAVLPGQAGIGVGRGDLGHVRAVVDRDRHLGRAGVVGADVDDRERVGDRLVRVLRLDRAVPLAGLRRGVIEVDDLEAVAGDDPADLGNGHVHAVLHAGALGEHRTLHGPRRVDAELALRALLRIGGAASATTSAAMPAIPIHFHSRITDLLLPDVDHGWILVSRANAARLASDLGILTDYGTSLRGQPAGYRAGTVRYYGPPPGVKATRGRRPPPDPPHRG